MDIKNLPNDEVAEKTVLGIMIMDNKKAFDLLDELEEEDFYYGNIKNLIVFKGLVELHKQSKGIDVLTLSSYLNTTKELDVIGGVDYLVSLTSLVTGFANAEYYVKTLKDYALLRKFFTAISVVEKNYNDGKIKDINKYVSESEQALLEITSERRVEGFKKSDEIARKLGKQIESSIGKDVNAFSGISTGFPKLDGILNGLQKGNLIVLAARPSVGKTALGLNIAYNCAIKSKKPVAIFSIEMSSNEIMCRLFSNRSGVPMDKISKNMLNQNDRQKLKEAEEEISRAPLYIDDTGGISIDDIISKSKRLKNDLHDLGLIVVDYIGKVKVPNMRTDNKVLEIDRVTGSLKQLAKDLDVPILALAQVNRNVEVRESAVPQLSNLKDSGSIEQDADQVVFIYNPEQAHALKQKNAQYGANKENNEEENKPNSADKQEKYDPNHSDLVFILVRKNRNGRTGNISLLFFKAFQRFDTPSEETSGIVSKYHDIEDLE